MDRLLKRMLTRLLAALVLLAFTASASAELGVQPVPELTARVTDLGAVLNAGEESALVGMLADFEARKGVQIAVLTVKSVKPEEIEQYSIRVVDAWRLGRSGIDDGALLIVAVEDRRVRIEVGRGLEGAITDLTAHRIIDENILPAFRTGDYAGGITQGVERLIAVADGEPLPPPQPSWQRDVSNVGDLFGLLFIVVLVAATLLSKIFGRLLGAMATGGLVGVIVWFASSALLATLLAAAGAFLISLIAGFLPAEAFTGGRGRGRRDGGFGGFGGGIGRGGGGFGGGFGGGGGGFGGGGASGRW